MSSCKLSCKAFLAFFLNALVAFVPAACSGVLDEGSFYYSVSEDQFAIWKNNGLGVDGIYFVEDSYSLSFSNGETAVLRYSDVPVVTIDQRGYNRLNGDLFDGSVERLYSATDLYDRDLQTVIEDYTEWIFVFKNGHKESLVKTLYSFDPDSVRRGINHRGYNQIAPENTLPAFRLSRLMGFKFADADIRFTSDGVPILLHDATIDRTSDGEGEVSGYSWEQLRSFDFGGWKSLDYSGTRIPSLEEFLGLCREIGLVPYLELKVGSRAQIQQIVSLVDKYNLSGEAIYISFSKTFLKYVSDVDPKATLGFLTGELSAKTVDAALSLRNGDNHVFIDSSDYGDAMVELCRNTGLPLEVWTINSKSVIQSLPSYISGVTSDLIHPGRVN